MDKYKILGEMSRKEKVLFTTGKDFWHTKPIGRLGVEEIMVADGPHGLRSQKGEEMIGVNFSRRATCFPSAVTSSSTWDRSLLEREGRAIGEEALEEGVSVVLGPGCNIKRNPLGGRNFEYFSEDPVLSGEMASSWIKGVEGTGTGTSLKHFAANSQEYKRMISDSIMDERTLREMYLSAFERAIKKGRPSTVMCSYNKINGVYCSDNKYLLDQILRKEWGWDGVVMTDWGAMNDRIEAIKAGCDLNMPGGSDYMDREVTDALRSGELDEDSLNKCVLRILTLVENANKARKKDFDWEEHHSLAVEIATKGAVLMKNQDNILPLSEESDVAYFGSMGKNMRYQGTGSSHINSRKLVSPMDAISSPFFFPCTREDGSVDEEELERAKKEARRHRYAVVFAGLTENMESESFDRNDMFLSPGHLKMIRAISENSPNTIVVLFGGSPVDLSWEDEVKGILYMGLPGEGGGEALEKLLFGKANPSGKLTESWPMKYEDTGSKESWGEVNAEYREGLYVGYRLYDKASIEVRRPFGFGLSYTSFLYSDLLIQGRKVSFKIKNIGERKGDEVMELYVENPHEGKYRAKRELRDFERISLAPGEERRVKFLLDDRDFSIYDNGWKVIGGTYGISIASSSRDIRLRGMMEVEGEEYREKKELLGSWYTNPKGQPPKKDFEALIGRKAMPFVPHKKGEFTFQDSPMSMKDWSLVMRIQYEITRNIIAKPYGGKKDMEDPGFRMMLLSSTDCPLRSSVISSGGMLSHKMAKAFLLMANGRWIKGMKTLLEREKKDE